MDPGLAGLAPPGLCSHPERSWPQHSQSRRQCRARPATGRRVWGCSHLQLVLKGVLFWGCKNHCQAETNFSEMRHALEILILKSDSSTQLTKQCDIHSYFFYISSFIHSKTFPGVNYGVSILQVQKVQRVTRSHCAKTVKNLVGDTELVLKVPSVMFIHGCQYNMEENTAWSKGRWEGRAQLSRKAFYRGK